MVDIPGIELTEDEEEELFFHANAGLIFMQFLERLETDGVDDLQSTVDEMLNEYYAMLQEADGGALH